MKLTVLGNTGPYPGVGGACSGYLLEGDGYCILLDFGNGTFGNLQKHLSINALDFIICSHLHPDHISDLYVLRYALQEKELKLPLYAPAEPVIEFASLAYKDIYCITAVDEDLKINKAGLKISFEKMVHPYTDYAIKIADREMTFLYTGDTAENDRLFKFAKGVDVMLCDCAFLDDQESGIHLSVKKVCRVANDSGVKTLILTHFYPYTEPLAYLEKASEYRKGKVLVTQIGCSYELTKEPAK